MKFSMDAKKLLHYLDDISLKGKYYSGNSVSSAKNASLSDYALFSIDSEQSISIANASMSVACKIDHWFAIGTEGIEPGMCVIDIPSMVQHLKVFSGEVTFNSADFITLTQDSKKASMSKVLNHPHMEMVTRVLNYNMSSLTGNTIIGEPTMPSVKFGNVEYECKLSTLDSDMLEVSKVCDVINNAKYKFEYNGGDKLTVSSTKSDIDYVSLDIELIEALGDSATVEFTGPFSKFMSGPVTIYMKDDSPIMFSSNNRMLIKAPYLSR